MPGRSPYPHHPGRQHERARPQPVPPAADLPAQRRPQRRGVRDRRHQRLRGQQVREPQLEGLHVLREGESEAEEGPAVGVVVVADVAHGGDRVREGRGALGVEAGIVAFVEPVRERSAVCKSGRLTGY